MKAFLARHPESAKAIQFDFAVIQFPPALQTALSTA